MVGGRGLGQGGGKVAPRPPQRTAPPQQRVRARARARHLRPTQPTPPPPPPPSLSGAVVLPALLALCAAGLLHPATRRAAAAGLAAFALLAALPAGRKSQAFRHARVWDWWRRHYRLRAVVPALPYVDPSRRYLIAQARARGPAQGPCVAAAAAWPG